MGREQTLNKGEGISILFGLIVVIVLIVGYFTKQSQILSQVPSSTTNNPNIVIRIGNPLDTSSRTVTFASCGSSFPGYKYTLKLPANWDIVRWEYGLNNVYYQAIGNGMSLGIGCTTLGVGDDLCDRKDRVELIVSGQIVDPCYGIVAGKWKLGVINLKQDLSSHATISFWGEGIEPTTLREILSSLKILEN